MVSTPVKNISQLELLFPIYINQININEYQQIIGGFNHLEKKNISQWEGLSHILWKTKFMLQTTNQNIITK